MSNDSNGIDNQYNDDSMFDFDMEFECSANLADMDPQFSVAKQIESLFYCVTKLGGEVSKLRLEMDKMQEQNSTLLDSMKKLREVILEKSLLDLDDFQLACDVLDESSKVSNSNFLKKVSH